MKRADEDRASVTIGRLESAATRHLISTTSLSQIWRIAALTIAGTIGVTAQAEAAVFWSDSDTGFSRPAPAAPPRVQRSRRRQTKQIEAPVNEAAKPQGPLIIAVSINKQNVKIYDANGFFAEAPVSTGMPGHATPMGAFSVIQKQKMHHSNIYSGAPMPFMQRITWSGVAMHAGVLPGHPASHGCIRMPMAFAVKMYGWTKMGARVVVTPGEMSPESFSHPFLVTQKVAPPVAAVVPKDLPKADTTAKGDKAAADETMKPTTSEAGLELRSTVGHDDHLKAVMAEPSAPAPLSEQTHTADAGAASATKATVTMSDASASHVADSVAPRDGAAPANEETKSGAVRSEAEPVAAKADETAKADDVTKDTDKPSETASPDDKSVETKSVEAATAEVKTTAADQADQNSDTAPKAVEAPAGDDAKADAPAEIAKTEPKIDAAKAEVTATEPTKTEAKPDDSLTATTVAPAADVKKDQARPTDPEKAVAPKPTPVVAVSSRNSGPISVFISRKDSKLYVRQNFAPLFDVPVTIAPSDRPLGTHIFTAEADKNDANILHWTVVTLPSRHVADRRDEDERVSRKRKIAGAAEIAKPVPEPDSPAEALDRLSVPADAMARITEALSTGGSIIVSDQGIAAGETGEGTDFIVSLR